MFTGAKISICCSVSSSIGEYQMSKRKRGGSESCHHDINHDMVDTCSLSRIITTIQTNSPSWKYKGVCMCVVWNLNHSYINRLNKIHAFSYAVKSIGEKKENEIKQEISPAVPAAFFFLLLVLSIHRRKLLTGNCWSIHLAKANHSTPCFHLMLLLMRYGLVLLIICFNPLSLYISISDFHSNENLKRKIDR